MTARYLASALLCTALAHVNAASGQQTQAAALERGSTLQRLHAIVGILDVPLARRDPGLSTAMAREATRVLAHYRSRVRLSDDEEELMNDYVIGLVRGMGESHDPATIPIVVEFAGFSRWSIDALLRFGNQAVPVMLEVAYRPNDELHARGGISGAFAELLQPRPGAQDPMLTEQNRERITAFAAQLLVRNSKLPLYEISNLVRVALATGRPDLRAEVERLATDRDAWIDHGVTDPAAIQYGQRAYRAQLKLTAIQAAH